MNDSARTAALQEYVRILDSISGGLPHLKFEPKHLTSSISRGVGGVGGVSFGHNKLLELRSFRVSSGSAERRHFEHAYAAFAR